MRALGLFLGALWLRFSWMGEGGARHRAIDPGRLRSLRQLFDGHEQLYLAAFAEGRVADPGPQAWPAGLWLWRGLGALSGDLRLALLVPAVAGALTAAGLGLAVARRAGGRAGLWAGLFAALLPAQVVWSTSMVPVVPAAGLVLLALAARRPGVALVAGAAAAALRPELAPLVLARGAPGLGAVAVGTAMLVGIGAPSGGSSLAVWVGNTVMVDFLGPFVLVGVGLLGARRHPGPALLVGAAFLLFAGFADLGPRHLLVPGLLLCGLAGATVARAGRAVGPLLGLAVVLGMGAEVAELRDRWHTRAPVPPAALRLLPGATGPEGCAVVSDEPPVPGQPLPSHWQLPAADCWLWGMAPEHTEWSSRGLRARARRMARLYRATPVAQEGGGGGRPWRLWLRIAPRPPRSWSTP